MTMDTPTEQHFGMRSLSVAKTDTFGLDFFQASKGEVVSSKSSKRCMVCAILAVAIVGIVVPTLSTAEGILRLSGQKVEDSVAKLAVSLEGDFEEKVSALDCQISYDSRVLKPKAVAPGPVAIAADKQVQWNEVGPGESVVVLMGMNRTSVQKGEILTVVFEVVRAPEEGRTRVAIGNTTLATPEGRKVPSRGSSLEVTLTGKSDENEPGAAVKPPSEGPVAGAPASGESGGRRVADAESATSVTDTQAGFKESGNSGTAKSGLARLLEENDAIRGTVSSPDKVRPGSESEETAAQPANPPFRPTSQDGQLPRESAQQPAAQGDRATGEGDSLTVGISASVPQGAAGSGKGAAQVHQGSVFRKFFLAGLIVLLLLGVLVFRKKFIL